MQVTYPGYAFDLDRSASEVFTLCKTVFLSKEWGTMSDKTLDDYLQQYLPIADLDIRGFDLMPSRRSILGAEDHAVLHLLKLIVLLSTNNLLQLEADDSFEYLIDLLQDIHPLEQFLNLIVNYDLYQALEALLDLRHIVTEIFSGNALLHAIEMGESRLIKLLLEKGCPLDASKRSRIHGCEMTALELAIVAQDIGTITLLLKAGCDPRSHGGYPEERAPFGPLLKALSWSGGHQVSDLNIDVFRLVMDAQASFYTAEQNKYCWLYLACEAAQTQLVDVFELVLEYLGRYCCDIRHNMEDPMLKLFTALLRDDQAAIEKLIHQNEHEQVKNEILDTILEKQHSQISSSLPKIKSQCEAYLPFLLTSGHKHTKLAWLMAEHGIRNTDIEALSVSLQLGLDISDPGLYLLDRAVRKQDPDLCRFLIANGAVPMLGSQIPNPFMGQLLHRLHSCPSIPGQIEFAKFLLQYPVKYDSEIIMKALRVISQFDSPELLEHFMDLAKHEQPSVEDFLQSEDFLKDVFYGESIGILQWLIARGFDLEPVLGHLEEPLRCMDTYCNTLNHICKSREMFRTVLNAGFLPSDHLVLWCASSPWHFNGENLELLLNRREELGYANTSEVLEICYKSLTHLEKSAEYSFEETKYWVSSLRFLQRHGIAMEGWLVRLLELSPDSISSDSLYTLDELTAAVCFHGASLFLIAVYAEDSLLLQQLIKDEAPLDRLYPLTKHGPAIRVAALRGQRDMVNLLLEAGTDPNVKAYPYCGTTPLQAAAIQGHIQIASDLLRAGAEINAPSALLEGRTALEGAAENGRLDMVCLLINHSHDLHKQLIDCKRAARLATANNNSVIGRMLQKHANKISEKLGVWHDEIDMLCICHLTRDSGCVKCGRPGGYLSSYTRSIDDENGSLLKGFSEKAIFRIAFGPEWSLADSRG